jgi:hypothetical protein
MYWNYGHYTSLDPLFFQRKCVILNIPKTASAAGKFGNDTQRLDISWFIDKDNTSSHFIIFFEKNSTDNLYMIRNITVNVTLPEDKYPDIKRKLKLYLFIYSYFYGTVSISEYILFIRWLVNVELEVVVIRLSCYLVFDWSDWSNSRKCQASWSHCPLTWRLKPCTFCIEVSPVLRMSFFKGVWCFVLVICFIFKSLKLMVLYFIAYHLSKKDTENVAYHYLYYIWIHCIVLWIPHVGCWCIVTSSFFQ